MPTVVGVGAAAAGQAAVTPPYPVGYTAIADDVAYTFCECEGIDTLTTPANWAQLIQVVLGSGTTSKLTVIWRRFTGGEAATQIADAGNHINARMIVIRGAVTTGIPAEAVTPNTETVSDTTVSIPGGTTLGANRLVMVAFGTGQDIASTAGATGWTNANLASLTERMDDWTALGTGGGFAMATGEKATLGAWGATTATLSLTANFKTLLSFAIPEAAAAPDEPGRWFKGRPVGQRYSQAAMIATNY